MKYQKPRGTQDFLPPDVYVWRFVESVFSDTLHRYGYAMVRTPVFEATDLFLRSVGEATDIVSKEMYTFTDRGGRSLTLRPENTASVIRAYLENGMHRRAGVARLWYMGPMFRYDRPQAGRFRQFHQVGAEAIGGIDPALDVEIIDVVMAGLERLEFSGLGVRINSVGCPVCRGPYTNRLREALAGRPEDLCEDCRERALKNPLRVFDCKRCTAIRNELPRISEHLCEECETHLAAVKSYLDAVGRTFKHDPDLVRGLDYYTKTTFEIVHDSLGAQNALCGGGRYDGLVEQCGGPATPAVGFSAGLERIISVLPEVTRAKSAAVPAPDCYVACADAESVARALKAATTLRRFARAELDVTLRPLKKQMKNAESTGARAAVIVGKDWPGVVKWKDMADRTQVDVQEIDLSRFARQRIRRESGGGE